VDAPAGESEKLDSKAGWLARERDSGRLYSVAAIAVGAFLLATVAFSLWALRRPATPGSLLSPPLIAALLIANLIPAIALMVLLSRRIAMQRAERGGLGSGRLHTRLVALFSVIAAVPTVLVAIFASLLFQSGLEFWFSDRARNMLENTVEVAQGAYRYGLGQVANEGILMSDDMAHGLQRVGLDDPQVGRAFAQQVVLRSLNEAAILHLDSKGQVQTLAIVNGYDGMVDPNRVRTAVAKLGGMKEPAAVDAETPDRLSVLTRLNYGDSTYLYAARTIDPELAAQVTRATRVLHDYQSLLARSRVNQLRFNAALLVGSLLIVALAILAALRLADRLVRPVGQLAEAAGRIEQGDFTARVPITRTEDEIQTLAHAFNRMTDRLQEQTDELRSANTQLDTRRAFIEAVLSSVTAGVVALDSRNRILLSNKSADALLEPRKQALEGTPLKKVSAELDEFMSGDER
jgi:two-component system nitrogen regulation sensor histidine kinase NtrY